MEDNESRKSELEMDRLSLIDVSSEDDCLLFSSFLDPASNAFSETDMDVKVLDFLGNEQEFSEEIPISSLQEMERVLQPHESPEPEKTAKSGKYNLRKSLAWDNAFFTSAGFLEPEELSSMMESNQKGEKQMLATIQEDVHRSTESISTLQSDCTAGDSHEAVLIEDRRVSIQRSSKASDAAIPINAKESEAIETSATPYSSKMDGVSNSKMKAKGSPKKPSIGAQGSRKTVKLVPLRPPVSQPVSTRSGLSETISKLPKGLSQVGPPSTTSTKRASLDVKRTKLEKDAKISGAAGKGAPATKGHFLVGGTKSITLKPVLPSKYSLRSSATSKNELTSSCSSLESCASASSGSSHKSYLSSMKKKNDSSSKPANMSSFLGATTSRVASRSIIQPRNPRLSTNVMPKAKLSPSTSPASSISEWSSESSTVSTPSKRANSSKAHHKTIPCERNPTKPHYHNSQNNSSDQSSVRNDSKVTELNREGVKRVSTGNGGVVHPTSMKPTGLRMPSPKIGFFDGVRTVARTPTGNVQTRPGLTSGMPRLGGHNSPSGSSSSVKSGKLQSSRSPLQESSSSKSKATIVSRSPSIVSVSSPKIQNGTSPKNREVKQLKAEDDNEMKVMGKNSSPASVKDKVSAGSKNGALAKEMKMTHENGKPDTPVDRNSASGDENITPSVKVGEEGIVKDKLVENQISISTKQIGNMDSNVKSEVEKDCNGESLLLASEQKAVIGIVDNVPGKKTSLAVNNASQNEDGICSVSTESAVVQVEDKAVSLSSPEKIPAGCS